jgi:selenocysteine lyase/cysteine desulfurase
LQEPQTSSPTTRLETPAEVIAFRRHFPIFRDKMHLASNSMGALSEEVIEAQRLYLDERLRYGTTWRFAMPRHEELRAAFADLIGAKTAEIALCASATQALGAVASCFDWRERPGIVFDEYSFPSTTYLWRAQEQRGADVRRVDARTDGSLPPQQFEAALDASTQIVATSRVCYKNGYRQDVAALARLAHDHGALMVVDDYQCLGTRAVDVRADDCDVLVSGSAKYLLGSPGLGFLYVKEELVGRLHPTLTGWFGQEDMNAFQVNSHDEASDARRFQTGTPALSAIYESLAAIRLLKEQGLGKVGDWVGRLTRHAMDRLAAEGYAFATPLDDERRGPQISIRVKNGAGVIEELLARGIVCSSRDGNIRTAWHYYNTVEDVDALVDGFNAMPAEWTGRAA